MLFADALADVISFVVSVPALCGGSLNVMTSYPAEHLEKFA
jgi:hypothetical protein